MSFTKLCERFMLLPDLGTERKKIYFFSRSGMHDKSSETRTILCLQCLSSPNKHRHRQHSSVTVLRRTTATRECQGQSLARAWKKKMPRVKFQALAYSTFSPCLPPQIPWDSTFSSRRVKFWHSDTDIQSSSSKVHRPDEMCVVKCCFSFFLFFFYLCCETWLKSVACLLVCL